MIMRATKKKMISGSDKRIGRIVVFDINFPVAMALKTSKAKPG
jgi:hypothetical protein